MSNNNISQMESDTSPFPNSKGGVEFSSSASRRPAFRSSDTPSPSSPYPASKSDPSMFKTHQPDFKTLCTEIRQLKIDFLAEKFGGIRSLSEKTNWAFPNVGRVIIKGSGFTIDNPGQPPLVGKGNIDFIMALTKQNDITKAVTDIVSKLGMEAISDSANRRPPPGQNGKQQANEEYARLKALSAKVDLIQLRIVLESLGAEGFQDKDRNKWKVGGVGNITAKGQRWFNHNADEGKRGAVSLVMHCMELPWKQAVLWLANEFNERVDSDEIKASLADLQDEEKKPFSPPQNEPSNIEYVRRYLVKDRALPENLVNELISIGQIYADEKKRCIFFSDGIAEIRSSYEGETAFKGLATGSTREHGFLVNPDPSVPPEYAISICESAIDSMSYRFMNPGRAAISGAGAGKTFPRKVVRQALDLGLSTFCSQDADEAGDKAAQALFNYLYVRELLCRKMGMDYDDADELFENKIIDLGLKTVPKKDGEPVIGEDEGTLKQQNRLFFNDEGKPDFKGERGQKPLIVWKTNKNIETPKGVIHPGTYRTVVAEAGWTYITKTLKVMRDRPTGEKDWNEILKNRVKAKNKPKI